MITDIIPYVEKDTAQIHIAFSSFKNDACQMRTDDFMRVLWQKKNWMSHKIFGKTEFYENNLPVAGSL